MPTLDIDAILPCKIRLPVRAVSVRRAVNLDRELDLGVGEVDACQEPSVVVQDLVLRDGERKSALDQPTAESRLLAAAGWLRALTLGDEGVERSPTFDPVRSPIVETGSQLIEGDDPSSEAV